MRISQISAMILCVLSCVVGASVSAEDVLTWAELPELPPASGMERHLGVAGPFAGISNDALIVAGGANFPQPVWESNKIWHDDIYVLVRDTGGETSTDKAYRWITGQTLDRPIAYGASVSTSHGVVCIGGNDAARTYSDVFLLRWDRSQKKVIQKALPSLPKPLAYSSATRIGDTVYVAGGTTGLGLETAQRNFWSLDLSQIDVEDLEWKRLPAWPGESRAFAIAVAQQNGTSNCVYVISGRRMGAGAGEMQFLRDVYEFTPDNYEPGAYDVEADMYRGEVNPWRQRADVPRCVMAGTGIAVGQNDILVLGGADGSLYAIADELKDDHPGFPKEALSYHTITDSWKSAGPIPANHVTTTALRWGTDTFNDPIIIPSGEIRPRVRSPKVWQVRAR